MKYPTISTATRLIAILALAAAGCATTQRRDQALRERTGIDVSVAQLRLQVRTLARPFGGILESAADRMLFAAMTPEERILALRIKINGIPAVHGALFEADPVGALFETAALLAQIELYVEEGPGRTAPELCRAAMSGAVADMRARLRQVGVALGVSGEGAATFWAKTEAWAREHPIDDSFVGRETTQALFAEYLATSGQGLRGVAVRMDESVQDLTMRFDLYAEYIAKQARWQAELLLEEAAVRGLPRRLVEEAGPIPLELRSVPFDVAAERAAALEGLAAERALVLDWAHAERLETLDFVRAEREAVAGLVGSERQIALDAVRAERLAVLEALRQERVAAMADLEAVVTRGLVTSRRQVVDHAFLCLAQLLAVVLPTVFLGALVLIWYARRPR